MTIVGKLITKLKRRRHYKTPEKSTYEELGDDYEAQRVTATPAAAGKRNK